MLYSIAYTIVYCLTLYDSYRNPCKRCQTTNEKNKLSKLIESLYGDDSKANEAEVLNSKAKQPPSMASTIVYAASAPVVEALKDNAQQQQQQSSLLQQQQQHQKIVLTPTVTPPVPKQPKTQKPNVQHSSQVKQPVQLLFYYGCLFSSGRNNMTVITLTRKYR